jgi:hypothetical protein
MCSIPPLARFLLELATDTTLKDAFEDTDDQGKADIMASRGLSTNQVRAMFETLNMGFNTDLKSEIATESHTLLYDAYCGKIRQIAVPAAKRGKRKGPVRKASVRKTAAKRRKATTKKR